MSPRSALVVFVLVLPIATPVEWSLAVDCNRNGREDSAELLSGGSVDCNENGIPDECDTTSQLDFELANFSTRIAFNNTTMVDAGDLDGDGYADVVTSNVSNAGILVHWNGRSGLFDRWGQWLARGSGTYPVSFHDLDRDERLDLLIHRVPLEIVWNEGERSFSRQTLEEAGAMLVGAGDLDGDGPSEIVTATGTTVIVSWGLGGREFETRPAAGELVATASDGSLGDVDGDSDMDAVLVHTHPVGLSVLRREGRELLPPSFEAVATPASLIHMADLNGDHLADVVLQSDSSLAILLNTGGGTFARRQTIRTPDAGSSRYVRLADLDGDRALDLAAATELLRPGRLQIWQNRGDGLFLPPFEPEIEQRLDGFAIADADADGALDVLVEGSDEIRVLYGRSLPPRSADRNRNAVPDECEGVPVVFRRADANDDQETNLTDIISIVNELFLGHPGTRCRDAGDANDDGRFDLSDALTIANFIFLGDRPPPAPYPGCGADATPDALVCDQYDSCP